MGERPQIATPEDLRRIITDARGEGRLDAGLSRVPDRGPGFRDLVAAQAMPPAGGSARGAHADEPTSRVVELLDTGHSRFPAFGECAVWWDRPRS